MKIALLGFDLEGQSSYEYFKGQGHEITICDQKTDIALPGGVDSCLGDSYLDNLDRFDLLLRTPGLPPHLILDKNPNVAKKISSQINEFFINSPTTNIIGVTGTKGKGTTSSLITKMLEATGKNVHLGGNIGVPALSFLDELTSDSWVVLELSSFQLIDLKQSPPLAVCLMVVPEHLNWHKDVDEYYLAKSQLFKYQTESDRAIYFANNQQSAKIVASSAGLKIPYFKSPGARVENGAVLIDGQKICETNEIKLPGKHNWQNACAAITAVWQVSKDVGAIRSALINFTGLIHRLELVREVDSVTYYDDSFGTTPETAMVAVEAFENPKVIILGGSDKGASYDNLAEVVSTNNVRRVILIGEQAKAIQSALEKKNFHDFTNGGNNMKDIVSCAKSHARPGDVVILSTGCASFDMFKNYKDRGEQFSEAVKALA
ncbi:MAG: UDP-N-acetylmuramoyl-L-alanine--D-glutamate ligase [Candidatus Saccharimonadales bacterium]